MKGAGGGGAGAVFGVVLGERVAPGLLRGANSLSIHLILGQTIEMQPQASQ